MYLSQKAHKELNAAANYVRLELDPSPAEPQMRLKPQPTPRLKFCETLEQRTQINVTLASESQNL